MEMLMLIHSNAQAADHIEKHIKLTQDLIDTYHKTSSITEKLRILETLKEEFKIIKSDAERALAVYGVV